LSKRKRIKARLLRGLPDQEKLTIRSINEYTTDSYKLVLLIDNVYY